MKESKKKLRNALEKRPDRSERGCSCISAPLFHLSCHCTQLPSHQAPSSVGLSTIVKLLPLCPTKIYCTACLHLQLCSSMFNRLSAPMVGYPRSRELIEAENPLHPCTLHPLASTCIHLQFTGTSRPTCYSTISTCSIFSVQHI